MRGLFTSHGPHLRLGTLSDLYPSTVRPHRGPSFRLTPPSLPSPVESRRARPPLLPVCPTGGVVAPSRSACPPTTLSRVTPSSVYTTCVSGPVCLHDPCVVSRVSCPVCRVLCVVCRVVCPVSCPVCDVPCVTCRVVCPVSCPVCRILCVVFCVSRVCVPIVVSCVVSCVVSGCVTRVLRPVCDSRFVKLHVHGQCVVVRVSSPVRTVRMCRCVWYDPVLWSVSSFLCERSVSVTSTPV